MKSADKNKNKKEKPIPKRCACGAEPILVKTRAGKMMSCPNPLNCISNLRTRWNKYEESLIIEWNGLVDSFYESQNDGRADE